MRPEALAARRSPASIRQDASAARERLGRGDLHRAESSLADRAHLRDRRLPPSRSFYVSLAPEQTWLGWLLHMMQAPRPFALSVHVQATERYRERMAQKRRYKRLYGVNRGVEQRGRPLDPDARVPEEEAARAERRARHERRRRASTA